LSSADYYDDYGERQLRVGINKRHRAIQQWLERFGLARGMDVLELGCGIGTVTKLIADILGDTGTLVAVDISPRSVDLARQRLGRRRNVELVVGDIVEVDLARKFDVIVLPDVIEHVPIELHVKLFGNVRRWLRDSGWVLVHMPNPFFLEWCHRNRPDLLQQLDQPIFTDALIESLKPNDLYIRYLSIYSIWVQEGDYQVIILKPHPKHSTFHPWIDNSSRARIEGVVRRFLGSLVRAKKSSGSYQ
jgi:trans-aconitate 2-methyltransferase